MGSPDLKAVALWFSHVVEVVACDAGITRRRRIILWARTNHQRSHVRAADDFLEMRKCGVQTTDEKVSRGSNPLQSDLWAEAKKKKRVRAPRQAKSQWASQPDLAVSYVKIIPSYHSYEKKKEICGRMCKKFKGDTATRLRGSDGKGI